MKQSKSMSLIETTLSTFIGLAVALTTQIIVFPLFGWNPPLTTNLAITAIFTAVSIGRQYMVRRLFEKLHIRRPLSPFMQAVIAERYRQIEAEGWSHDHDDRHELGDLASAGACYANCAGVNAEENKTPPTEWPWECEWWKPAGFRRDLVKAGALIIAEGERFDRRRSKRRNAETRAAQSRLTDDPHNTRSRSLELNGGIESIARSGSQ